MVRVFAWPSHLVTTVTWFLMVAVGGLGVVKIAELSSIPSAIWPALPVTLMVFFRLTFNTPRARRIVAIGPSFLHAALVRDPIAASAGFGRSFRNPRATSRLPRHPPDPAGIEGWP